MKASLPEGGREKVGEKEKVVLSWSGGKDSAMALYELRRSGGYDVVSLLTTVASEFDRVSHHGVRAVLLEQQAAAVGVPLHKLYLPSHHPGSCTMEDYEGAMREAMLQYKEAGVLAVAHGDIFLQDLREYREKKLASVGMKGIFPIWHRNTTQLMQEFITLGFKAYLSCVDARKLGEAFAGRPVDVDLLRALPEGVDPCGEYGEFHSFVYDGPIFIRPVGVRVGQVVLRESRYFADLLPARESAQDSKAMSSAHRPEGGSQVKQEAVAPPSLWERGP